MSEAGPGEWPSWPGAMGESATAAAEGVPVDIGPGPAETMTEAGAGWFSPRGAVRAARLVVAAWVAAVNGEESALRALAELAPSDIGGVDDDGHDAAYDLLHPVRRDWMVAPRPEAHRHRTAPPGPAR